MLHVETSQLIRTGGQVADVVSTLDPEVVPAFAHVTESEQEGAYRYTPPNFICGLCLFLQEAVVRYAFIEAGQGADAARRPRRAEGD